MTPPPAGDRRALEERQRIVRRDLEELAQQVADGEIGSATAAGLEARYRAELAEVEKALAARPPKPRREAAQRAPAQPAPARPAAGGSLRRTLWIMGAAIVVLTGVIILLATRGGGGEAAATTTSLPAGPPEDLAQMEAVVAAHPESNGMRLALADMYFDRGEYLKAMEHYVAVLDNSPDSADESVALARVGWMAYITDQVDTAVAYLQQAIEVDPAYGESKLFLGVVLLCGKEDPAAALPILEEVLTYPDLPDEVRPELEAKAEQARSGVGGCEG
jgi:tetratricopeptide (TPR) repeat protein